jgi:hypothetical protein
VLSHTYSVAGPPTHQFSPSWHSPQSATLPSASPSTPTPHQAPGSPYESLLSCGVCLLSAPHHSLSTPKSTTCIILQVWVDHWNFFTITGNPFLIDFSPYHVIISNVSQIHFVIWGVGVAKQNLPYLCNNITFTWCTPFSQRGLGNWAIPL